MKKIFNNGLRVFNTAMFMAAVVATTLFASCSKDSVNQNDPVSATQEKTQEKPQEQTKEKTQEKTQEKIATQMRLCTKFSISNSLVDYIDIKVTATGTNGEEIQNARQDPAKRYDDITAFNFYFDNNNVPGETNAKVEITLKDKTAQLPKGGLDVSIAYRWFWYFKDANNLSVAKNITYTDTQSQTIHVDTPEQLQEAVKTIMSSTNLDKIQTFKFDAKGNVTTGVVQQ